VTWKEVKRIPTGKEPHHLYLTPDEKSVIVANALSDSLTFIDPRTAEVQRRCAASWTPTTCGFRPT
jgi:YVTN family beta-propeller protein